HRFDRRCGSCLSVHDIQIIRQKDREAPETVNPHFTECRRPSAKRPGLPADCRAGTLMPEDRREKGMNRQNQKIRNITFSGQDAMLLIPPGMLKEAVVLCRESPE